MNLLIDPFISTTSGKISLRQALTTHTDATLQYAFDETQLAVMQLLSGLVTAVLQPTLTELRKYIHEGVSDADYDSALSRVDITLFDDSCFMRSKPETPSDFGVAGISKLVSGIESGTSANACGLFSDAAAVVVSCPDCMPALNYNLHMNIKGECFAATGATGIRGGGALSILISGDNLGETLLYNAVATDFFASISQNTSLNNDPMWVSPPTGSIYFAHDIGLVRGLFSLAYHIDYVIENNACICDICGHAADQSVSHFSRLKYLGKYGSTKSGRDEGAGIWPHPYTPVQRRETGDFFVSPQGEHWRSWEHFGGFVIGKELEKSSYVPAPIIDQYRKLSIPKAVRVLVGGNIADQGSITGRIYDLYSVPKNWNENLDRVTIVIDAGVQVKVALTQAINKIYATTYDPNLKKGIRDQAVNQFVSQAQQIIQSILVDADFGERKRLRKRAIAELKSVAINIYNDLMRKHENDLPLFTALAKGQKIINMISD